MSNLRQANVLRLMGPIVNKTQTSASLVLKESIVKARITVSAAINIDKIVSTWEDGRMIQLISAAGNSDDITIRDNQSGSNLKVDGTSITLGATDSVWFRADIASSGAKVWMQDTPVMNIT